jgi:catechol 2,3-dioxygenase-like lactoylglutathione lyase family enzyme
MDHVVVVVEDLEAGISFFKALGMEPEGRMPIEGPWVDRVNGLTGIRVEIAMMKTPDGHNKVELTRFNAPQVLGTAEQNTRPNTLGLRSIMFEVDDVAAMLELLKPHGGTLIGEVADYEDVYRLCYVRGPAGIIVALAEALK